MRLVLLGLSLLVLVATNPALGAGRLIKATGISQMEFACDAEFRDCRPTKIEPIDAPPNYYEVYTDAVVRQRDGDENICVPQWRSYDRDGRLYSCRVVLGEGRIFLYERFGEPIMVDGSIQMVTFIFSPLDCFAFNRRIVDGKAIERRFDYRCEDVR